MRGSIFGLGILLVVAGCSSRETTRGGTDAGGTDSGTTPGMDAGTGVDGGAPTDAGSIDGGAADDSGAVGDAGSDSGTVNDAGSGGRTIVTEECARSFGSCSTDLDCQASGCGGETCAPEEVVSTCDCVAPSASCGCVAGACAWYR